MAKLTTEAALRRVAMLGLPDGDIEPFEVESPDQLLMRADTQRVGVRLDRAVSSGLIHIADEAWRTRIRDRAIAAAETTLAAHGAAITVARLLDGIDFAVLKGCATGPLDYDDSITRFSSDVDILVAPGDLDAAVSLLGPRIDVERSQAWHDRFGHAVTTSGPAGVEIDVHVRVNHGYVGLSIPTQDVMDTREEFVLGGQTMSCPDRETRLIIAAVHADGVHRSLHAMRDVPQLVIASGADWEAAVERCRNWQVDAFFARGVIAAWNGCGLDPHPILEWAQQHEPRGRQRLAARLGGDRSQVLAGPLALPLREWAGYVGPLIAPRRQYVEHGGKSWAERRRIMRSELKRRTDR